MSWTGCTRQCNRRNAPLTTDPGLAPDKKGTLDFFRAMTNIGRPAENAWLDRLPRLELSEVVREG